MARWRLTASGVVVTLVLATLASACGGGPQRPQIKWRVGSTLPEDFPKDVPVYPEAKLESAITGEGLATDDGAYVAWYTDDKIPAVRHFYAGKLDEEGWHVVSYPGVATAWMGEGGVTVIGTKWGRTVSFALGAKGERTLIALVIPLKG